MEARTQNQSTNGQLGRGAARTVHNSDWKPFLAGLGPRPPNLLVVGASGHVAQAFLLRLQAQREKFGRVVLLDPCERVRKNLHLDHQRLEYRFIKRRLRFPEDSQYFRRLLALHQIDIVLDLTDLDTIPILAATDAAGISYVNTAASKYLYAIHPRTMDYLNRLWAERGRVNIEDLEIVDNISEPLEGSDTIGVCLNYPDKRVYYLHSLANADVTGTNATCAQVAVGVEAALAALISERLSPRIYFASDLYGTVYRDVVFKSLRVEQFVFERRHASLLPETAGLSIGRAAISPVNPRAGLIRPGILG